MANWPYEAPCNCMSLKVTAFLVVGCNGNSLCKRGIQCTIVQRLRLQCYLGFDKMEKKLDMPHLLSCQKIYHLLIIIVMLQGDC